MVVPLSFMFPIYDGLDGEELDEQLSYYSKFGFDEWQNKYGDQNHRRKMKNFFNECEEDNMCERSKMKSTVERLIMQEECGYWNLPKNHKMVSFADAANKIKELEEVLKFYADEEHYRQQKIWTTTFLKSEPNGYKLIEPVVFDNGERARAALKESE